MKNLFIYLFLSYLLIGCDSGGSTSKKATNDTLLFYLTIAPPQKEQLDTLFLSEIADSIKYTQLKTSSPMQFYSCCNDDNFVAVLSNSIQLYNNDGDFLCNIGSAGRGHGEYIRPKWTVSEDNDEIYIYSPTTSLESFLVYGTDGKYKKKIENGSIKAHISQMLPIGNNIALVMPPVIPNPNDFTAELILFDPATNSVIDSIPDYYKVEFDDPFVHIEYPVSALSIYDDNLYYLSVFADTLYKISPNKIEPLVVFDYGQYKYKEDMIKLRGKQYAEASNNTIKPMAMLATNKAIYIQFLYSNNKQKLQWITKLDLESGSIENYDTQFLNDIDNGPDYELSYFGNSMLIDIATLLEVAPEQVAKYKAKDVQSNSKFTKILNKSNGSSNSIIMKPHIK